MTNELGLDALGDPTRRAIIAALRRAPTSVGRLAHSLPVSRPAVSQHLKVLAEAGLVRAEAQGNKRVYSLHPDGFAALRAEMDALWDAALGNLSKRAKEVKDGEEMIEKIQKTVLLPIPARQAFALFTGDMASWWPLTTHSLSASSGALPIALTVEGRVGGQVRETLFDGSTGTWGRVTIWQPPRCFAMTWHVGRPETEASRIEVRFADTPTGCTLDLCHDGWEVHGTQGANLRENYNTGWDGVLGDFVGWATSR